MNPYALAAPNGILDATTRLSDIFLRYPLEKQAADREARMARMREQMMGTQIESQGGQLAPEQLSALGIDPSMIRTGKELGLRGERQTIDTRAAAEGRAVEEFPLNKRVLGATADLKEAEAEKMRRIGTMGTWQERQAGAKMAFDQGHAMGAAGTPVPNIDGGPDLDSVAAEMPGAPPDVVHAHAYGRMAGYQAFKQQKVENDRKAFGQTPEALMRKRREELTNNAIHLTRENRIPGGPGVQLSPAEQKAWVDERLAEEGYGVAPVADPRAQTLGGAPPPRRPGDAPPPKTTQTGPGAGPARAVPPGVDPVKAASVQELFSRLVAP